MPGVTVTDPEGNTIKYNAYEGLNYGPIPNFDDTLQKLPKWRVRDNDIMILAFPKSGTHWVYEIANMLLAGKAEMLAKEVVGTLEVMGPDIADELPSPRILNTHLRSKYFPVDMINRKCKLLYVMRNPKDVFTSFYFHAKNLLVYQYSGTWDSFFELQMNGQADYGSWFDYTKDLENFLIQNKDLPVLTLYYESLKKAPRQCVQDIAKFLDTPCNDELCDGIVDKCSFSKMKQLKESVIFPGQEKLFPGGKNMFYRKGEIGDWKNFFTVAQNERFNAEYDIRMEGSAFKECFKPYI